MGNREKDEGKALHLACLVVVWSEEGRSLEASSPPLRWRLSPSSAFSLGLSGHGGGDSVHLTSPSPGPEVTRIPEREKGGPFLELDRLGMLVSCHCHEKDNSHDNSAGREGLRGGGGS